MLISFTPEPPALSAAARLTVTAVSFQPLAFAAGDRLSVVVGGVISAGVVPVTYWLLITKPLGEFTVKPDGKPKTGPEAGNFSV